MKMTRLCMWAGLALSAALMCLPAQAATQNWVVIGDSIMAVGVPGGQAKNSALALVTQERDVSFKNLSSPGAALGMTDKTGYKNVTTINMLDQLDGYWGAVTGIIIQAGTNDWGRNVNYGATYDSVGAILSWARSHNKKVLMLDPIWRAGEDGLNGLGYPLNTYRFFMANQCISNYADVCKFAHREDTIMGTSAGAAYYDATEVATNTQTHPNVQGHRYLADWIKAQAAAFGYF